MVGAADAGTGAGTGADVDSMTGADSGTASGLTAESVGSTETDMSSVPVLASASGASSASIDGFTSTGVDAMVVMPALAFSGS